MTLWNSEPLGSTRGPLERIRKGGGGEGSDGVSAGVTGGAVTRRYNVGSHILGTVDSPKTCMNYDDFLVYYFRFVIQVNSQCGKLMVWENLWFKLMA